MIACHDLCIRHVCHRDTRLMHIYREIPLLHINPLCYWRRTSQTKFHLITGTLYFSCIWWSLLRLCQGCLPSYLPFMVSIFCSWKLTVHDLYNSFWSDHMGSTALSSSMNSSLRITVDCWVFLCVEIILYSSATDECTIILTPYTEHSWVSICYSKWSSELLEALYSWVMSWLSSGHKEALHWV